MDPRILDLLDAVHARLHRWRWSIRLALALLLIPWLGYWLRGWMSLKPADPSAVRALEADGPIIAPPPEIDRTSEMIAALAKVPIGATIALPTPPAGMRWVSAADVAAGGKPVNVPVVNPTDALAGEWDPQARPELGQIVAFLNTPAITAALDEVVVLADQPFCVSQTAMTNALSTVRFVASILAVRARCRMAEGGDFERALTDLRAALHLAAGLADDGTVIRLLAADACRHRVLDETMRWTREFPLTPEQIRQLRLVLDETRADAAMRLRQYADAERRESLLALDAFYSRDADGNGYAVLRPSGPIAMVWRGTSTAPSGPEIRALRVLNVAALALNDRRTMTAKINAARERMRSAEGLSRAEAIRLLPRSYADDPDGYAHRSWNAANGVPGILTDPYGGPRWLDQVLIGELKEQAARAALGLAAYHAEHRRYPEHLADLVPTYLSELPRDPVTHGPLLYRLDEREGYVLYSAGPDGRDDGGIVPAPDGYRLRADSPDWIATQPRDKPFDEWVLQPIGSSGGSGADTGKGADEQDTNPAREVIEGQTGDDAADE